jgi:hypothetical protein
VIARVIIAGEEDQLISDHVIINDLHELSCLMGVIRKNTEQSGEEIAIYFPRSYDNAIIGHNYLFYSL